MKYESTRGNFRKVSASKAIQLGMVPEGGLFVPEIFPKFEKEEIYEMTKDNYQEIAFKVLKKYLTDFSNEILQEVISNSYRENFDVEEIVPVVKLGRDIYLLELWHGPTAAFKDLPLQFMPRLLSRSIEKETIVLVATSGDTGKAALEGFKNVPGTYIIVFFPKNKVSKIQELQMVTTGGNNTAVVSLEGNFDDCQNGVKKIFGDKKFKNQFRSIFSSANSINWGRLAPQIVYWFHAYSQLLEKNQIEKGEEIDIVVPTGNFGNILSSYYSYRMGLPIDNFICASNENNVLTDFFQTGNYNANRKLKETISPAMDILISSNLERFLYDISGKNARKVQTWYRNLEKEKKFDIGTETKRKIEKIFHGKYTTQRETTQTIGEIYNDYGYLLDPHTAVGVNCFQKYIKKASEKKTTLIASTANPFKFAPPVLEGITGEKPTGDEFEIIERLKEETDWPIHRGLKNLKGRGIKQNYTCSKNNIRKIIREIFQNLT